MKNAITLLFNDKKIGFSALLIFFGFGAMSAFQFHGVILEEVMLLNPDAIGTVFMMGSLSTIAAPIIVTTISSLLPNPNILLSLIYLLLTILFITFPQTRSIEAITIQYMAIALLVSLVFTISQTNIQISTKEKGSGYFLFLRAIGTLGFAVSCLISAHIAETFDLHIVYYLFSFFSALAFLTSLKNRNIIPDQPRESSKINALFNSFTSTIKLLLQPNTALLLLFVCLANISANMGSTLIGNFVRNELNSTNSMVGTAWYIATFAEVPLILFSIYILKRFNLKVLIATGMAVLTLRMYLISISTTLPLFLSVQTLHGLFYGATLAGTSIFFKRVYGDQKLHFIQIYSGMFIAGIGGAFAGKFAGYLWHSYDLRAVYSIASLLGALSLTGFVTLVKIPEE